MRDLSYKIGARTFWLRYWCDSPRLILFHVEWAIRAMWDSKKYREWYESPFWTRTLTHDNSRCYCPVGITTEFHFRLPWCGFWFEVQRGIPKYPCPCDRMNWLLFPDGHEDEIEDYGLAKLQAEYPGIEAIR